jgi:hypothetical protein
MVVQNVQYSLDSHDDKMRRLKESHATRRAEAHSMLREVCERVCERVFHHQQPPPPPPHHPSTHTQRRTEKMESDKQRLVVTTKINQQEINAKQLDAKVCVHCLDLHCFDSARALHCWQIAHTHQEHMAEIASMRQRVDELEQSLHTYHHQLIVAISQTAK